MAHRRVWPLHTEPETIISTVITKLSAHRQHTMGPMRGFPHYHGPGLKDSSLEPGMSTLVLWLAFPEALACLTYFSSIRLGGRLGNLLRLGQEWSSQVSSRGKTVMPSASTHSSPSFPYYDILTPWVQEKNILHHPHRMYDPVLLSSSFCSFLARNISSYELVSSYSLGKVLYGLLISRSSSFFQHIWFVLTPSLYWW
jgi:hypothetical protein